MKGLLLIAGIAAAFAFQNVAGATTKAPGSCTKQPPVPAGSKWVANAGCPNGPTYNDPGNGGTTFHCHCWCHQGYICDPKDNPKPTPKPTTKAPTKATTKKPATTTKAAGGACTKQPPVPAGGKWVDSPNCPEGPTYNDPGNGGTAFHCHCWCHKGYICDPKAGTTKKPATTTKKAASTTKKAGCPNGPVWIPPNDPTQRCVCQSFAHESFYKCTPMSTTTSSSTTGSGGTSGTASGDTSATTVSGATTGAVSTTGATTGGTTGDTTTGGTTGPTTGGTTGDTTTGGTTAGTTTGDTTTAGTSTTVA